MRILHISSARAIGGGEKHLINLARGLDRRGHEVYAAIARHSPLQEAIAASLRAENVLALPLRNALDISSAVRLAQFAREQRIDIIHAHLARDYPLAAFAAQRVKDARLVITRHVMFPLSRLHALTLSQVARVIAVSEPVARALRARGIFPPQKIRVIPNGIDIDSFDLSKRDFDRQEYRRRLPTSAPLLVGMVGELSEVKGQEDFVRAAAIIARRRNDVEFVIVGEDLSHTGERRERIERMIGESNLRQRVYLMGRRKDVPLLLSALDLFVSASRVEAFGLAIVEAMASGTPVVATATDGACEIIDDGATGRLVPVGDAQQLAMAIDCLLDDPPTRARLGDQARQAARHRFSLNRMITTTEEIYTEARAEKSE